MKALLKNLTIPFEMKDFNGGNMNYNEFLEQIKELEFEELREDQPEYMEFVIATNHLNSLSSILESYYVAAYAAPEERPSKQAQKYADSYGGIKKGQTLYYLNRGEVFYCALLWPWGDGKATTIKIIQGENEGIAEPIRKSFGRR